MSKRAPYSFVEPKDGRRYWRSLEERAELGDAKAMEARAAEFPNGHTATPPSDEAMSLQREGFGRRGFLSFLGGTLALAGAEGCRRPVEKVVPYAKMPEEVIPGIPTHYATVYRRRGDSLGLLVESHEGRPTKIEGNPDHPSSLGAADLLAQASILDLYDPDRSRSPKHQGRDATWEEVEKALEERLAHHETDQGAKLRILMEPTTSPTVVRLRGEIAKRFPKAKVYAYAPVHDSNAREGAKLAFGQPVNAMYAYDRARVILALDCDFLQTESGNVRANKLFAAGRRLRSPSDTMNRLYVVEPALTTTGSNADHRLRLPASHIERYLVALAAQLAQQNGVYLAELAGTLQKLQNADGIPAKWLGTVAKDLASNRGRAFIVAGARQPARVHALVHAINVALGSAGTTVLYSPVADPDERDVTADIKELTAEMAGGNVETLLILGGNPAHDAPADVRFADALAKVPNSFHLSSRVDETGEKCAWHLPRAHEYEAWGDQQSLDGTIAVQQPLIAPLYGGRSDIELLAMVAKAEEKSGHDLVRKTLERSLLRMHGVTTCEPADGGKFDCKDDEGRSLSVPVRLLDRDWKRALRDGFVLRGSPINSGLTTKLADVSAALEKAPPAPPVSKDNLEVTFAPCPKMFDGRHANNVWLLELPDPVTKIVWDNVALMSPTTANALGIKSGDMLKIARGPGAIEIPAWVLPGQADWSIALALGWGRTKAGHFGKGKGFDVYPIRTSDAMGFAAGVKVDKTGAKYEIGQTQTHNSMEGRAIARDATLAEYKESPNFADLQSPPPRALPLWKEQDYSKGYQWGMSIDLNACTGCNACVVACQAENNVPVVGKVEVARGREMYWLRLDRYFVEDEKHGASADDPLVAHQPLMCVQCEEAPCENVCPVNATTHSPEGLNDMVYNRCIGTRYCANNCPYKVRRFNYLNWHNDAVFKEDGQVPEAMQLQHNPNVTVRFRGVMEKCTYCVQRIQAAKIKAKRENRTVRDGEITTACQQTCSADAITFGDLNDPQSRVSRLSKLDRQYKLLAELGTKPRTTYLGKVRNPNPEMGAGPEAQGAHGSHKEHG